MAARTGFLGRVTGLLGFGRTGYEAGRHDTPELNGWAPSPGYVDSDLKFGRDNIVGRARDLDQNDAWVNGAIDRRVEAVVGGKIMLSAQPAHDLLGRSHEWRMQWASDVQPRFKVWGNDIHRRCDARKKLSFGAMVRVAYLHYVRDGEIGAEIRMDDRGARYATNVMLFDSDRIGTPETMTESARLRNGVAYDRNSAPIGYWIRSKHPLDHTSGAEPWKWDFIPAQTSTGKTKFIHVFNPRRIEQSRGVSRLVEAIVPAKMLERVDRAEVNASLLSAVLSFFIKSPASTDDVEASIAPAGDGTSNHFADYLEYREKRPVRIASGAQINHLFPGEDVVVPDTKRPNGNYAAFQRHVLQKIASSFGISYPQLSQDWAGINYSSARALLNEMWRSFLQDRDYFTQAFCTPIYAAWLEEAVALGDVKVPGGPANFYRRKTELTLAEWIGPGRGTVDPLKESNANNLDAAAGRKSTVAAILEDGRDPSDVLAEEGWYLAEREKRGLAAPNYNTKPMADELQEGTSEDPKDDAESGNDRGRQKETVE